VTRYRILSWQDIPSVLKATGDDGVETSRQLPDVFQQEIDREAMRQGLTSSDDYLAQWSWSEPRERAGDPDDVLAELAAELERELLERRRAARGG
jgi:Virulence factor